MDIYIGTTPDGRIVCLLPEWLCSHLHVMGRTGMGKTKFLANLCLRLMEAGLGVIVIDPFGGLIEEIKRRIPQSRIDDVILFQASDQDHPFALNPLAPPPEPHEVDVRASQDMAMFQLMCDEAEWNSRTRQTLRNILLLLHSRPNDFELMGQPFPAGLDEISPLLTLQLSEDGKRRAWNFDFTTYRGGYYSLVGEAGYPSVRRYFENFFDKILTLRPRAEIAATLSGILDPLMSNRLVRNIVGQTQTKIDFEQVIDKRRIFLADLSGIGNDSASFVASVLMARLHSAAFARPRDSLTSCIVGDEFHRYATETFRDLCTGARQFGVAVVGAQQSELDIRSWQRGIMGSGANKAFFQLAPDDSRRQAPEFASTPPEADDEMRAVYLPFGVEPEDWDFITRDAPSLHSLYATLEAWRDHPERAWEDERLSEFRLRKLVKFLFDDLGDTQMCKHARRWSEFLETGTLGVLRGMVRYQETDATTARLCLESFPPHEVLFDLVTEAIENIRWIRDFYETKQFLYVQAPSDTRDVTRAYPTGWDGDGRLVHRIADVKERGQTLYSRVAGRRRPHADVRDEVADELTHLPQRVVKGKFFRLEQPPLEVTFRSADLPDENPNWEENWEDIVKRSRRDYTRDVAKVDAEVKLRDELMTRAVEMWHARRNGGQTQEPPKKDGARQYRAEGERLGQ